MSSNTTEAKIKMNNALKISRRINTNLSKNGGVSERQVVLKVSKR